MSSFIILFDSQEEVKFILGIHKNCLVMYTSEMPVHSHA